MGFLNCNRPIFEGILRTRIQTCCFSQKNMSAQECRIMYFDVRGTHRKRHGVNGFSEFSLHILIYLKFFYATTPTLYPPYFVA